MLLTQAQVSEIIKTLAAQGLLFRDPKNIEICMKLADLLLDKRLEAMYNQKTVVIEITVTKD